MTAPPRRRSRSRAMVSVSGSSGILRALELAPADVTTELLPLERDRLRERRAPRLGLGQRLRRSGDRKDASACGDERAVVATSRTGVEDLDALWGFGQRDPGPSPRMLRVARRGDDSRHRVGLPPLERLDPRQAVAVGD